MAVTILKRGGGSPPDTSDHIAATVAAALADIAARGEAAVREMSMRHDAHAPASFRLSDGEIADCLARVPQAELDLFRYALDNIRGFAAAQRQGLGEVTFQPRPGVTLGHRLVPVASAGCYIPGGRHPHIASAFMSVATAAAAGVPRIVACLPPRQGRPDPRSVAAIHLSGAHEILCLGGIQAIGAMAHGLPGTPPVDFIAGPGNAWVAEAKRQLWGRVGIDMVAGPTEVLLIADDSAGAETCAADLIGQAEHGPTSPAVLVTNSLALAEATLAQIDHLLARLPTGPVAAQAWRDHGQVILCDSHDEMAAEADRIASEHVQVMTRCDDWYLDRLRNYGALFLGARTNVAFGDKVIGTNHILPTGGAARHSGGLWVGSFLKVLTWQRIDDDAAAAEIGAACAALSLLEGFAGHAEQAGLRIRRAAPAAAPASDQRLGWPGQPPDRARFFG